MSNANVTPNRQPNLAAQNTVSGKTEYVTSTNGKLNVNASVSIPSGMPLQDGANSSILASVFNYTNSKPLAVRLTDTNGDYIAAGGGTEYTDGGTPPAHPVGKVSVYNNAGTWASVSTTNRLPTAAAQNGTWNITNISGTISLPTGASTSAKQPALGTAGTPSADVITIQGATSMTAVKVDGSGVTQPVSGTVSITALTDGSQKTQVVDSAGGVSTVGSVRANKGNQLTTITTSTAETTIVTANATKKLDLYGLVISNTSGAATNVTIKDSTGGSTRFIFAVPAGDTRGFMIPASDAHPQNAANNNWTATSSASVSSVNITALYVAN